MVVMQDLALNEPQGPEERQAWATRTGARSEGFGDAMLRAMVTLLAAVFFPWT